MLDEKIRIFTLECQLKTTQKKLDNVCAWIQLKFGVDFSLPSSNAKFIPGCLNDETDIAEGEDEAYKSIGNYEYTETGTTIGDDSDVICLTGSTMNLNERPAVDPLQICQPSTSASTFLTKKPVDVLNTKGDGNFILVNVEDVLASKEIVNQSRSLRSDYSRLQNSSQSSTSTSLHQRVRNAASTSNFITRQTPTNFLGEPRKVIKMKNLNTESSKPSHLKTPIQNSNTTTNYVNVKRKNGMSTFLNNILAEGGKIQKPLEKRKSEYMLDMREVECPFCQRAMRRRNYPYHLKRNHLEEYKRQRQEDNKVSTCPECGKTFNSLSTYKWHMTCVHFVNL